MTNTRRVLVTMPFEMVERVHAHRIRGRFKSESAAAADLVEQGIDWLVNRDKYREQDDQLQRLRLWGQSIP